MTDIIFTVDDNDIAFLKGQWEELLSFYTPDGSARDRSFQGLRARYSERDRFYHNLGHVRQLLYLFESLNDRIHNHNAVRFSIWLHDVIYNTRMNDNENESARLASELLTRLQVDAETIRLVADWILATKGHSGGDLPEDGRLFLDMDLSILGMGKETYEKYSRAIRSEYFWVPETVYRKSRMRILRSFIDRESIYRTDEMKERFEEQARKNIHEEIRLLESR